jgi:hypothetical protein
MYANALGFQTPSPKREVLSLKNLSEKWRLPTLPQYAVASAIYLTH